MRTLTAPGLFDLALAAAAGVLALRWLVISAFLLSMGEGRLGAADFLLLTAAPLAAAAAAAGLLALRGPSRVPVRPALALLGLTIAALAARPPDVATKANALGLASQAAGAVVTESYAGGSKDGYPPCTMRLNSLGFRDEEPPAEASAGRRLVLLVGDSFVWGDGIPVNEETLGYALRAELERIAPGRFSVMSAAYRGLGLYGYGRFIATLSGRYKPAIVVVGYLGANDDDPFDSQYLLDHLPRWKPARNLVLNLGAAQHVHDASVKHFARIWRGARNRDYFESRVREIAERGRALGVRLVFLSYFEHAPLPVPIEALDLPEALRYPGRASGLWYGKDFHPKTTLNRILANTLAAKLAGQET